MCHHQTKLENSFCSPLKIPLVTTIIELQQKNRYIKPLKILILPLILIPLGFKTIIYNQLKLEII